MSESFVLASNVKADQQPRDLLPCARISLFFANPCLDGGWILRPHSLHRPHLLSAHDHRFPLWGISVALDIDDSYPQQVNISMYVSFDCQELQNNILFTAFRYTERYWGN